MNRETAHRTAAVSLTAYPAYHGQLRADLAAGGNMGLRFREFFSGWMEGKKQLDDVLLAGVAV